MVAINTLSLLALAGSALAAPAHTHRHGRPGHETVVHTVIVTAPVGVATTFAPRPTPTPEETQSSTAVLTTPTAGEAVATSATIIAAPSSTGAPNSTGTYMDIVTKWRTKLGLDALTQSSMLEGNALKCVTQGNGEMKHQLFPGTYAQVLAPGQPDGFEKVFVGGWLCERPTLKGLDDACGEFSKGWAYGGQTGHADILTSKDYKSIGCAIYKGIWGCDLA